MDRFELQGLPGISGSRAGLDGVRAVSGADGLKHGSARPLKGFGGAGALELVADHVGDTFRAVYTVKFATAVYVLHAFQKKSKPGIKTPTEDMELIQRRLKAAEADYKAQLEKGKAS
jgi:phage-related protein